jgi:hypothetical protein
MKDRDATAVRNTRTYSRKPTLLLDVGPGKTGSSAIQAWLANKAEVHLERPRPLRYVAGVSWPRSGHHLLVRMLKSYFGKVFEYCEFYEPQQCCKQFPCARRGVVHFSKNHDFDGTANRLRDVPLIIQEPSSRP